MRIEAIRGSQEPMCAQIARQVRSAIVSGEYKPGDHLPTHDDVAHVLGVNQLTVQRAYSELERAGLVVSEGRKGTVVAETITPAGSPDDARRRLSTLVDALMVEAARGGLTLDEIFEELEWSAGRHALQLRKSGARGKPVRRPGVT